MKRAFILLLLVVNIVTPSLLAFPIAVAAAVFDPGLILTEEDLFRATTMDTPAIQAFLDQHEGVLKTYAEADVDGLLKTAAMIIADAAKRNQINPQYLLTTLQKEQGLITNPIPKQSQLDWATGYAACDSCDVDHPGLQKYKGFAKQVDWSAKRTRHFYENPQDFTYQSNTSFTINGEDVLIKNQATAVLYNYTPHISGNRLFWKIYTTWFTPVSHPDGSLLQVYGEPGVWLIAHGGQRHAFKSKGALTSRYSLDRIIQVQPQSLEQYPVGAAIPFAEYSLVLIPNGHVYLLVGAEKRWIEDEATFKQLGFTWDEVTVAASAEDLAYFDEGTSLNLASSQPFGALVQDPESFGIYYVVNGLKYPLTAPELLTLNFAGLRVRKAADGELERYPKGEPVLLKDGLLVKSPQDPRVYVIANGRKLPVYSELTFNTLGYQWTQIQTVTDALLQLHPTGDSLRIEALTDEEINALSAAKLAE